MKNQKLIFALTATLTLITFQACQKTDTNALQEAQLCLNTATASTAKSCVASIASNTTAYADSLRCSAIFIAEGFSTPAQFIDALNSINTGGNCTGGCSSTVNAINTFKFTSSGDVTTSAGRDANNAAAAEAFTVCTASNVKFYAQISSLFKIGTMTAMLAYITTSGVTPTQDQIKSELTNLPSATVGDIVIATSAAVCTDTTNASTETKAYCAELAAALASPAATPTSIGDCLKAKLADTTAVCSI